MGMFYFAGEQKTRPGVYQRYEKTGTNAGTSALVGVLAVPIQAEWGPLNTVTVHEGTNSVKKTYGSAQTVDAALEMFTGGAIKVYCYRLGTGGTAATCALKNEASTNVLNVTAKYPGTKSISVAVRAKDTSTVEGQLVVNTKEIVVYSGTEKVESFEFSAGGDETTTLIASIANSDYITAAVIQSVVDHTIEVTASTALTGGVNPTVTTESYSDALNAFEPYDFNMIALDTVASAPQAVLIEWLARVYQTGKLCFAATGAENSTKTIDETCTASRALNDEKVLYFGDYGYESDGTLVDGYNLVCRCAGVAASTPSSSSIVHASIPGIATINPRTNTDYEKAIKAGAIMFSYSPDDIAWFDSGITTLITPSDNQDDGWKKYRRVATRFELMDRVDQVTAPLVGKVNCDNDGVATVIQYAQGVLNDMVKENKLMSGATIVEDEENPHAGDSAWFVITADDIDSLEKMYFKYQFRYSSNS